MMMCNKEIQVRFRECLNKIMCEFDKVLGQQYFSIYSLIM